MSEFLPPSMPEETAEHPDAPPLAAPSPYQQALSYETPALRDGPSSSDRVPSGPSARATRRRPPRPGPLGRLVSLIVSVGLAWAIAIAVTAWLLGLFLARG